jgi:hypothetical protein
VSAWKLWRLRQAARRYTTAAVIDSLDDDVLLGALAMAEAEHGVMDPADLASVIEWEQLRRRDETVDAYRERRSRVV